MYKVTINSDCQWSKLLPIFSLVISCIVLLGVLPAEALKCNGQFQVTRADGEISTPYCADNYLASIARSYGWKVSNKSVRDNPILKARICRHIRHDFRLRLLCSKENSDTEMPGREMYDDNDTSR